MVDAVQTRRHDEAGEKSLNADRQFDVGVMNQYREEDDVLPDEECVGWDADYRNLHRAPWDRERELAGMEAECGRRVEIAIDMMNQVEPPQPGDPVREHVPHVEGVVEEDDRQNEMKRRWKATHIQQSESSALDHPGQRLDDRSFEEIDRRRGGAPEYDIARHVTPFRFAGTPQRTTPFECGEHHERASHDERRHHPPPGRATH